MLRSAAARSRLRVLMQGPLHAAQIPAVGLAGAGDRGSAEVTEVGENANSGPGCECVPYSAAMPDSARALLSLRAPRQGAGLASTSQPFSKPPPGRELGRVPLAGEHAGHAGPLSGRAEEPVDQNRRALRLRGPAGPARRWPGTTPAPDRLPYPVQQSEHSGHQLSALVLTKPVIA